MGIIKAEDVDSPSTKKRNVATGLKASLEVYADAVVAAHLPDREREWRLRDQALSRRPEGLVITVKEELEYDAVLHSMQTKGSLDARTRFGSSALQYADTGESQLVVHARTQNVKVRIMTPRDLRDGTATAYGINPQPLILLSSGMGCQDRRTHANVTFDDKTASAPW